MKLSKIVRGVGGGGVRGEGKFLLCCCVCRLLFISNEQLTIGIINSRKTLNLAVECLCNVPHGLYNKMPRDEVSDQAREWAV